MKNFIHDNFTLETDAASRLYHDYASTMPIIDYHNHLSPSVLSNNDHFNDIVDIWLKEDHYKWRAMRANGIPEEKITGNAPPREKFRSWANTVQASIRNPLYHWAHIEMTRYFGINDLLLGSETADEIYDLCNEVLADKNFSAWEIIKKMNVEILCTTDDPVDNLEFHVALAKKKDVSFRMYPAWRPDRAFKADDPVAFNKWISELESASNLEIKNLDDLKEALKKRHDFFHHCGCRISDYGMTTIPAEDYTDKEIAKYFDTIRRGESLKGLELDSYRSAMLHFLIELDAKKEWSIQIHMGVLRNNNSRMFKQLGPDAGFDSIGDFSHAAPLIKLLDYLNKNNSLPRTILYPINPSDNAMIATMIGNFQDGTVPGKIQFGPAWWFLDQKTGMEEQMSALSAMGLLSRFIGMTTDSRSLLSFSRHEYFRRILCNLFGNDMEKGLVPIDFKLIGGIIQDIACNNAKQYFKFPA